MVRPTLIDKLSHQKRELAANMQLRNEPFDLILKYIDQNEGVTVRKSVQELADNLAQPMSEPMYQLSLELAQTDFLIGVANEKAEDGSTRHMSEFTKMSTHRIKLFKQLAELEDIEEAKGRSWSPLFDTDSVEYRIFQAAAETYLTRDTESEDDFDTLLSTEDQARFLKIMVESS